MSASLPLLPFFPPSIAFRGLEGVLRISMGMKSPYPMKAEGRCLDIPRRCLS